jgi:hypothetical protein
MEEKKQTKRTKPLKPKDSFSTSVPLDITEEDFSNPAVAKRMLAELQTTRESLRNIQDQHEDLRDKYHTLDKEAAVLKTRKQGEKLASAVKNLLLVTIGAGLGYLGNRQFGLGGAVTVISLLLYGFVIIITRTDKE